MFDKGTRSFSLFSLFMTLSFSSSAELSDDFVTTWKTDNLGGSNDTSITISTDSNSTYSYHVDWDNDGIFDEFDITGDVTHDFGVIGEFTIRISGVFPRIRLSFQEDKDKIISIDQWGTNAWTSMGNSFYGASNLVNNATDTPNLSICVSLSFMFQDAALIGGETDTGNWAWDTSNIEDFSHVFFRALAFNKNISSWQTANASSMSDMFFHASNFNQDLSNWNYENISNFGISGFLTSTSLSIENYDALLISLATQNVYSDLLFKNSEIKYCTKEAIYARQFLTSNYNWTIQDSGRETSCNPTPDLEVQIINFQESVAAGELVDYSIFVSNRGSQDVIDATFADILPPELINSTWTCSASGINSCTASGIGQINDTISIVSDSLIIYQLSATITNDSFTDVFYQAHATIHDNQSESDLSNNYDSDLNFNEDVLFVSGFEAALVTLRPSTSSLKYDFSKVSKTLGYYPKPIARKLDNNGASILWIHIRNNNEVLQIRLSTKMGDIWQVGGWQNSERVLTKISWLEAGNNE